MCLIWESLGPYNHDPPFHAFFPKKRGLAEKSAVSLLFCPFLRFFGPKKALFPCLGIFYPRFFRQNCAFLGPQMPFALRKKSKGRNNTKKAQETKKAQKGGSWKSRHPSTCSRTSQPIGSSADPSKAWDDAADAQEGADHELHAATEAPIDAEWRQEISANARADLIHSASTISSE